MERFKYYGVVRSADVGITGEVKQRLQNVKKSRFRKALTMKALMKEL